MWKELVYLKLVDGSTHDGSTCGAGRVNALYRDSFTNAIDFTSATTATLTVSGITAPTNVLNVCYYIGSAPETGVYARLGTTTLTVMPATTVTGIVGSVPALVVGRITDLHFVTTDLFDYPTASTFIKLVASGTACGSGIANAIGGLAGQLGYVSATDGVLTLILLESEVTMSNPVGCFRTGPSETYTSFGVVALSGTRFTTRHAWDMRGDLSARSNITDSVAGAALVLHGAYTPSSYGVEFRLDAYASLGIATQQNTGGAMSIEMMVQLSELSNQARLFEFGNPHGGEGADNVGVYMNVGAPATSATLAFFVRVDTTDTTAATTNLVWGTLMVGNRYHVVCTTIGLEMEIYVNGVRVAHNSFGAEPRVMARSLWYVARSSWNVARMHGTVSSFKIYDGALDQEGVRAALASSHPPTYAGALLQLGCGASASAALRTCRVEGGEVLFIIGTNFDTITSVPTVTVGGIAATGCNVTFDPGWWSHIVECTTPCLVAFGSDFPVELTADTATGVGKAWNSGLSIASAASYQLVPQLTYVCTNRPTMVSVTPLTAVPGTTVDIVGTNFGPGQPPAWILAQLFFGVSDDCASLIVPNSWSNQGMSVKVCAVEGTALPMSISIGGLSSPASSAIFTVIVDPNTPSAFGLMMLPNAVDQSKSDVSLQWSDPSSACPTAYQIWYTFNPKGLDYAASAIIKVEHGTVCSVGTFVVQTYTYTLPVRSFPLAISTQRNFNCNSLPPPPPPLSHH